MRRAHDIAFEFVAQDFCIPALCASGHRLPDPRESLVPIQPTQLDDLAVQFETVIGELSLAEPEPARIFVRDLISVTQAHTSGI